MSREISYLPQLDPSGRERVVAVRVGEIVGLDPTGQAVVDYPGNTSGPLVARSIVTVDQGVLVEPFRNIPVLILFDSADPRAPVVVGVMQETLIKASPQSEANASARQRAVMVDGERLVLEAKQEIVLRCGKGSITVRKDGKIMVKGTELVSRASNANKIKGGTVCIN